MEENASKDSCETDTSCSEIACSFGQTICISPAPLCRSVSAVRRGDMGLFLGGMHSIERNSRCGTWSRNFSRHSSGGQSHLTQLRTTESLVMFNTIWGSNNDEV